LGLAVKRGNIPPGAFVVKVGSTGPAKSAGIKLFLLILGWETQLYELMDSQYIKWQITSKHWAMKNHNKKLKFLFKEKANYMN
jgi:hypothetical protein